MTPEDEKLLLRLRERDDAARRELHDRHHEKLRRYFRAWLPEADDLANEVLTRAWERLDAGARPTESVDQWLWGIARNVRRERERTQARTVGVDPMFFEEQTGDTATGSAWVDDEFDGGFDNDGKARAVQDAWEIIQRLTRPRRIVLVAHLKAIVYRGYEMKGAELAQQLGSTWSRAKVDRDLSRAKAEVRQQMSALAVARAAAGCPAAAKLIQRQPEPRLPVAELSGRVLAALAKHANPVAGSATEPACKRCSMVYRDAQRSGLYALGPGAVLLAARMTPDDEQKQRVFAALLSRDRTDTGLLQRGRDVAMVGFARVTQLPVISAAIQAAQGNPMAVRTVAVVASLGVALFLASASPPANSTPREIVAPSAPSSAPSVPSATSPAQPQIGPTSEPSIGPTPQLSVVPTAEPTAAAAVAGPPVAPSAGPTPDPVPSTEKGIVIDARAVSHQNFTISTIGSWPAREVRSFDLKPGRYGLTTPGGATPIGFTIDEAGVVDYDPSLTYLSGRGSRTLTILGLPLTVDATALVHPHMGFSSATQWLPNKRQTVRLLPGEYNFTSAYAYSVRITLTASGTIDFDPALTYVSGRGSDVLTVSGLPLTINATALGYQNVGISGILSWPNTLPRTVRLLPGRYTFYPPRSIGMVFTLNQSGTVDYDPLPYVFGQGSSTLTVTGMLMTVDATGMECSISRCRVQTSGWTPAKFSKCG